MLRAFYEEEQVRISDDLTLRLSINFRAIDAIENLVGQTMEEVVAEVVSGKPRLSLTGKVLWGLLREHHPESTLDEAAGLMFDAEKSVPVGYAMGELLRRAFNLGEPKAKGQNPPKRRGASKAS